MRAQEKTHLVGAREVGELLLELCRLVAAATAQQITTSHQVVLASLERGAIICGREVVCIVTKNGLLAGKEVVGRGVSRAVLDICLGWQASAVLASVGCSASQGRMGLCR